MGVFLAKGANDPFGEVYIWMFDHIPGFIMFRDPTKWYTLIAISYSILLPFSTWHIYTYIQSKKIFSFHSRFFSIQNIFLVLIVFCLGYLIKPAIVGQLNGTFKTHTVSEDYIQLKDIEVDNDQFYRTLWLPKVQRFSYNSQNHPSVESSVLFNATTSAELITVMKKAQIENMLQDLSIRYIIIPYDAEKEIFVKDRKYNQSERDALQKTLDASNWLKKQSNFKDIDVYEITNYKDRISLRDGGALSYKNISGSRFAIHTASSASRTIIFNETYSPYWKLKTKDYEISSTKFHDLNSFIIPQGTKYTDFILYYSLEKYYLIGRYISAFVLLCVIFIIMVLKKKRLFAS